MSIKYVVGYDGSDASNRAVQFAVERAVAAKGSLVVAHVLEWSPYSFLTPEELEQRHKRRTEELSRAETAVIEPLMKKIGDQVPVSSVIRYGATADTLNTIAKENEATQIFIGRQGSKDIASRVFGSAASKLAQIASVPCTIVP